MYNFYKVDVRIGLCPCQNCEKYRERGSKCPEANDCRDWALWKIRKVQVSAMDYKERKRNGIATSYEACRAWKARKAWHK